MRPDYATLTDELAEDVIFTRLCGYDEDERLRYAGIGLMAQAVYKRLLWKFRVDPADGLPCRSFARWVKIACPYSYSTCYAAMRDCDAMPDVSAEDLAEIPQSNFATLKQLSTHVRASTSILYAAKTAKTSVFVDTVRAAFPDQHIEAHASLRLNPTESQRDVIQRAIDAAIQCGYGGTREEVIEGWASNWLMEQDGASSAKEAVIH